MLQSNVENYSRGFPVSSNSLVFSTSEGPEPYESNSNLYEDIEQFEGASDRSMFSHERPSCSSAETTMITSDNSSFEHMNQNVGMNFQVELNENIRKLNSVGQNLPNSNFYAPSFMMTQRTIDSQMNHTYYLNSNRPIRFPTTSFVEYEDHH
jgi:hypothetical protein